MSPHWLARRRLTNALKEEAIRLGFDLVGATAAAEPAGVGRLLAWLAAGYVGEMHYLAKRVEAYRHPHHLLPGAKSLLMLGVNYRTEEPLPVAAGQGRISRYAWGIDYHGVIRQRLRRLCEFHHRLRPTSRVRGVVDTAPLLEREFAQRAGLGWIGKNTMLVSQHYGSWLFLAALVTSEELSYDEPSAMSHCGSCRACLDACPTGALVQPYQLDARRCISYLTIESRHLPEASARACQGAHVFGCDICQEVCPWNHRTPASRQKAFRPLPESNPIDLASLWELDEAGFRRRFRDTPLWRAGRCGLLRNAAIVLANRPSPAALTALIRGLGDKEPMIRAACVWALGRYRNRRAQQALRLRLSKEPDEMVRAEFAAALQ